ncbi:MAG TPA: hypothetical protein VI456_09195 [Polyangia bacterium]
MSRDADPKVDSKAIRLFDKRTVERNIKKGLVTRKDYEKHMKGLEDVAGKGLYGGLEGKDEVDDGDAAVAPAGE